MMKILTVPVSGDFIVAMGGGHGSLEFVEVAFGNLCLDWNAYVEEDAAVHLRKPGRLIGSASKLRATTGWKAFMTFSEMVEGLLSGDAAMILPGIRC